MLTLYGRANSPNVSMVTWAIAELGLPVQRLDVGGPFGGTDTPAFRAMNPMGQVPVLQDDHVTLFEAGAILRYLGGRYGRFPFWPEDPVARAPVDVWAEWGKLTLFADFRGPVFRQRRYMADPEANAAALARDLDVLEARLAGGTAFVAGPDLTLADIVIGTLLYRYFTADLERPDRPALAGYYDRLCERPAYAETVMILWPSPRPRSGD